MNKMYFGTYSVYEEYYAIGESAEEVKKLLWRMYCFNCYNRPTKEDRKSFEEEVNIREIKTSKAWGYNTQYKECYKLSGNKLERLKGE